MYSKVITDFHTHIIIGKSSSLIWNFENFDNFQKTFTKAMQGTLAFGRVLCSIVGKSLGSRRPSKFR